MSRKEIKTDGDARKAREWLMRSVYTALDMKLSQIMEFMVATLDAEHEKTRAEIEGIRALFVHIDALDWDYLERVLINTMRNQEDNQTRIWIDTVKSLRVAITQGSVAHED